MNDPRIDEYIASAADFAKPILERVRALVHEACPDVEETTKWGMPFFEHQGILLNMAAFKAHCAVAFWKGELIFGKPRGGEAMGDFGRIASVKDLPPEKDFIGYVKQAMKLNADGVKVPSRSKPAAKKPEAAVPDYLAAALEKNTAARTTFENFSLSQRREYIEWMVEAKTEATREKRMAQALEWMAEGKSRHWKYERK